MRICLKNLMLAEISAKSKNHSTVGKRGSLLMQRTTYYTIIGMGSNYIVRVCLE